MKSPFVIREYVRWGDVDLAGIICYGAYIRFFELAETEVFRAAGLPFREMFERYDMWLPRRVMHAEFHASAYQVLVCVEKSTFRKKPLPPDVVRLLEPFVMPCEEARRAA